MEESKASVSLGFHTIWRKILLLKQNYWIHEKRQEDENSRLRAYIIEEFVWYLTQTLREIKKSIGKKVLFSQFHVIFLEANWKMQKYDGHLVVDWATQHFKLKVSSESFRLTIFTWNHCITYSLWLFRFTRNDFT